MSEKRSFVIPSNCSGITVKAFARQHLRISSRSFISQKYIPNGMLINDSPCRSVDVLQEGDILTFSLPAENPCYIPVKMEIELLYEDENFLAVNKPADMPVHPSPGHGQDSLLNAVAQHYLKKGRSYIFRPMYRLDRDTSGAIWIAKNRMGASSANIGKIYCGVCQGKLKDTGTINLPISLREDSRIVRTTENGQAGCKAQTAITHWRVITRDDFHCFVAFFLETGRTHQIRVHMSHMGHPIAGDDLYGGSREYIIRQALHCFESRITCNAFDLDMYCRAGIPNDVKTAFPKLFPKNREGEIYAQLHNTFFAWEKGA